MSRYRSCFIGKLGCLALTLALMLMAAVGLADGEVASFNASGVPNRPVSVDPHRAHRGFFGQAV